MTNPREPMKRLDGAACFALALLLAVAFSGLPAGAHHEPNGAAHTHTAQSQQAAPAAAAIPGIILGTSGQGKMRFKVLYTSDHLPPEAKQVLKAAHGGFAVDLRPGKGQTYFALPGAGILQISADLRSVRLIETPDDVKKVNLHNTTLWNAPGGQPYLVFPANNEGKVFTFTLDGKLVNTLSAPTGEEEFKASAVKEYFAGKGRFSPTDVEYLDGLYYVTTGYSPLDFVLTARLLLKDGFRAAWNGLAFGGKGDGPAQFRTAHGITVPRGKKSLDISDRPKAVIKRFSPSGDLLGTVEMPPGSFPCDIYYLDRYAVVGSLNAPDKTKGAPIYILEDDKLVSTIQPKEELGLQNFQHIHNAVLRRIGSKYYIIVQAWNPGDFAILEQAGK